MARTKEASLKRSAGKVGADSVISALCHRCWKKDRWGNWVINKPTIAEMLAEAVCKLEGFVYMPSDAVYWPATAPG